MRIYTCATRPFIANAQFFARDSGLLCRAFQKTGVESKVILPRMAGREAEDTDEILRVSDKDFVNPLWWKSLGIDGVVFFAWGFKEDTPAIRAARESGVTTCALFDHNGNNYPVMDFFTTLRIHWIKGNQAESFWKKTIGTLARGVYFGIKGLPDCYHRAVQFSAPHIAAFNSPSGMERNRRLVRFFNLQGQSEMVLTGWPIPDDFTPLPREQRQRKIVAIARWDALRHKRPHVLMKVIEATLEKHGNVVFELYGFVPDFLKRWHENLPEPQSANVHLMGIQPSEKIAAAIGGSMVLYCPSASDGIPLCVIEGLGGGCSVVGLDSINVAGMHWAISEGDGTFAVDDRITSHVTAISQEMAAWEAGDRDPLEISTRWRKWFAASSCAERFADLISHYEHTDEPCR